MTPWSGHSSSCSRLKPFPLSKSRDLFFWPHSAICPPVIQNFFAGASADSQYHIMWFWLLKEPGKKKQNESWKERQVCVLGLFPLLSWTQLCTGAAYKRLSAALRLISFVSLMLQWKEPQQTCKHQNLNICSVSLGRPPSQLFPITYFR